MLGWSVLVLFVVVLFLSVLLIYPAVQTGLATVLTNELQERTGLNMRVQRIEIRPFGPVHLHGVHIKDLHGDTLIHVDHLWVKGLRYDSGKKRIRARSLELDGGRFALRTEPGDTRSNLTLFLNELSSKDTTSATGPLVIECGVFKVHEMHFSFHDPNVPVLPFGVDLRHVDTRHVNVQGSGLNVVGDTIRAQLDQVGFMDRSGLVLERFSGGAMVGPAGIQVDDMVLRTTDSRLIGDVKLITNSLDDLSEFEELVELRIDLDSSLVDFADIAYFAPDIEGMRLPINVSGRFRGTIADLKARDLELSFGTRSRFQGDVDMTGLPDIQNTFMYIDAESFLTDASDLSRLPVPPFLAGGRLELPAEIERLGTIRFSGNFTGFVRSFTAFGKTRTDAGSLTTDISMDRNAANGRFAFRGSLTSDGFDLGKVLDTRTLGPITSNIRVDATGSDLSSLQGDLEGEIPLFTFNGSTITNIEVDGHLEKDLFDGALSCRDPKLDLLFDGTADLRGQWPVVNFTADLHHADLVALNIVEGEGFNSLNVRVNANADLDPDDYVGTVEVQGISYCDEDGDHELGDLFISREKVDGRSLLQLRSDAVDLDVRGKLLPTTLPDALASVLFSVFPALSNTVSYAHVDQDFDFELTTRDTREVFRLFVPDLVLSKDAHFAGHFNGRSFDLGLSATIPYVEYGVFSGESVEVVLDKTMDVLAFSFESARGGAGDSTFLSGVHVSGKGYQDELEIRTGWAGSSAGSEGDLFLSGEIKGPTTIELDLLPSRLFFGRGTWSNRNVAHFHVDTTSVLVSGLELQNEGQMIRLEGHVSDDPSLPLVFDLAGVRMENLHPLLGGPVLHGSLEGDGRVFGLLGKPVLLSYLCVDSFAVQDKPVGDLLFAAAWNEQQRFIDVNGNVSRGSVKALDFNGKITPGAEQELDLRLFLDRFDLAFLEPYMPEGLSDVGGRVSGSLTLDGRFDDPRINGRLDMTDAGIRVDYLGMRYTFSHEVIVRPDMFAMDFVKISDPEGNTATAIVTVIHEGLTNWNYNISVVMDGLMCLNTTSEDNSLFFGKAYADGDLEIGGRSGHLEITVDANSAPGTDIAFPLGGSTEISSIDYVRFFSYAVDSADAEHDLDLSGVQLDMNVHVTPEARFQLIFDPTVGDIMSGNATGDIKLTVTPSGEFAMQGGLEVVSGEYLFTLRNILNKRFDLVPGGRITWYGDPLNAQLDMSAIYRLRAPLYNVMVEDNDVYRKRVPVEVNMNLTDRLVNPGISYSVRLPTVDEDVRSRLNSILSTPQELNTQVFSLIVLNNFSPPQDASTQGQGLNSGTFASTTGSELLSNQVSNWLSSLSNDLDLGLNYRPGDEVSQDEVELAVSTQLLNSRLILNTTVGVQYGAQSTTSQNTLIGDFQVEYLMTPDGKFRLKAYNISNDQNLNQADQAQYTQGVGVGYREDFNDFGELWQKVKNIFRSDEKDRLFPN